MAEVSLQNLTKTYARGSIKAVDNLSLDIADGEFLVLVGPSGCGKSTALRMIAGLEEISEGAVWIGDQFVNDVHPKDRDIAMVFQNYALYPHMTVFDNIAFALQVQRLPKAEIAARVHEAARILELTNYLKRRPGQLSGGQRQRAAMGRAIVRKPAVFLMDEPLSNLDAKLRVQMRAEISALQHRLGVTTIYVTHDQTEAMTMGDRVALLKDGVLQQIDTPTDIYHRPANTFVAAFIGSPTMNLYHGEADGRALRFGSSTLVLDDETADRVRRHSARELILGIRPEDISDAAASPMRDTGREFTGPVELFEELGSDTLVHLGLDARPALIRSSDSLDEVRAGASSARCIARFTAKQRVRIGENVTVQVDVTRLHLFDAQSGEALPN
jgi:multiple sugar transport system ATP-binding protein